MKRLFLATVLVATALLIGACASYRHDAPTQRAMEEPWMPPKALAAFEAGEARYEAGNMKKAIAKFEQAVDIYPDFGDAYARLEMIYRVLDRYQDLIRVLEERKRLCPERADTIQWSIDRYRSLETPPRAAIKALNQCQDHMGKSRIRTKKAIALCKKAIRIHPSYTDAHYFLGVLFISADDEKSAKEVVAALIPLDPLGASPMLIHVMTKSKPQWLSDSYSKELERLFAETEGGTKQATKSPRTRLSSDAREYDLGKCSDTPAPDTYSAILPEMVRVGSLFSIGKYEVTLRAVASHHGQ